MFIIPPSGALGSTLGTVSIIWGMVACLGDHSFDGLTLWARPLATNASRFPNNPPLQNLFTPPSHKLLVMRALALATFSHAGCQGLHWAARLLTVSILMTELRFFLRRYICMYTNIDMYTYPIRNFPRVSRHPHGFLNHSFQIRNP